MASLAAPSAAFSFRAIAPARRGGAAAGRRSATVRASGYEIPDKYKTISPLGDRVLIKIAEAETQTTGGIILAESSQRKPTSGDVTAVGPDVKGIKVGSTVLYNKFGIGITELETAAGSFCMIKEMDLIGTFPASGATAADIPQLIPCGDRVLLDVEVAAAQTAGGILLTEGAKEKPISGTVVSAGPGKEDEEGKLKEMSVKAGDKVLYFKYAGDKMFDTEGKEYIVLYQNDILGKL